MRSANLPRLALVGAGLLALIVVPFLLFGQTLEVWAAAWMTGAPSTLVVVALVVGLLAADIVLPLPSSLIAAGAAMQLGFTIGASAIFAGLMTGNLIGYAMGRRFGVRIVDWAMGGRFRLRPEVGTAMLVLTRAVPVLAEAVTMIAGASGYGLWRFVAVAGLSNLGIALCYGALGSLAADAQSFLLVFFAAIAVPALGYSLYFLAGAPGARDAE